MDKRKIFGPTYGTRNQQFEVDDNMYIILNRCTSRNDAIAAFCEGLRAGRIMAEYDATRSL